jgi:hypothetical protein
MGWLGRFLEAGFFPAYDGGFIHPVTISLLFFLFFVFSSYYFSFLVWISAWGSYVDCLVRIHRLSRFLYFAGIVSFNTFPRFPWIWLAWLFLVVGAVLLFDGSFYSTQ